MCIVGASSCTKTQLDECAAYKDEEYYKSPAEIFTVDAQAKVDEWCR